MFKFIYKEETDSTSNLARQMAEEGEGEWLVIVAERQTAGRGRRGKSFLSPEGGLYFSVILKPMIKLENAYYITTAAAVATVKAIKTVCKKECGIKWVNDIYLNGRKVCGILTEGVPEGDGFKFVILGIGINIIPPEGGFDDEIKDIAGALFDKCENIAEIKEKLLKEILSEFDKYYKNINDKSFIEDYKAFSIMEGKKITVHRADGEYAATVLKLDDNCNLLIQKENGEKELLSSGEISIKISGQ